MARIKKAQITKYGYFEDDGTYVSTSASKVFAKVQASLDETFEHQEKE
jgi:hypothetical protein